MTRIRRDRSSPHYNQFQRYTTKEHRNSILKLRCKSKRGDPRSGEDERQRTFRRPPASGRRYMIRVLISASWRLRDVDLHHLFVSDIRGAKSPEAGGRSKGMAIRGLVSGMGPAPLGRMSASEPFACTWDPRGRKQVPSPRHGI